MHHRIMVRRERESKSEIAGFGGFNLPFPAISNRLESEKETPAQSLRTLFTDDYRRGLVARCDQGFRRRDPHTPDRIWQGAEVGAGVCRGRWPITYRIFRTFRIPGFL